MPLSTVIEWESEIGEPPPHVVRSLALMSHLATSARDKTEQGSVIASPGQVQAVAGRLTNCDGEQGARPAIVPLQSFTSSFSQYPEQGLSLVSLFAGAGGLDIGLEQAGFQTLFANEVEPYATESLRANKLLRSLDAGQFEHWFESRVAPQRCYQKAAPSELAGLRQRLSASLSDRDTYLARAHIEERDVRQLDGALILGASGKKRGEITLLAGGPPCQPFSRAGKRELVECDTGQLFLDFVRLVDEVRPRFFLFENVKGLVLHKADVVTLRCEVCGSESLAAFEDRQALKDAEHASLLCEPCGAHRPAAVIWSKRRAGSQEIIEHEFRRIGYSCTATVLNAADFGAPQSRERLFIVGSRDNEQFAWPKPTHGELVARPKQPTLFDLSVGPRLPWRTVNETLYREGHWRYGDLDPARAVLWVKNVVRPHDEPVTWTLDRVAPTIGAHQSAKLAIAPHGVPEEQLFRQQWHVLGRRQGDTKPVMVEHEYLTDEELLRLQTFPTSWYLHGTRMQRAFQIGNAVPPVLARAVGEAIRQAMSLSDPNIEGCDDAKRYAAGF